MAHAWCHRMQYFFSLAKGDSANVARFTPAQKAQYVPPYQYVCMRAELVARPYCSGRIKQLENLFA